MRRILTYASILDIQDAEYYRQIRDIPQIAASTNLCNNITSLFSNVTTFNRMRRRICSIWESRKTKTLDICLITQFINKRLNQVTGPEATWLYGCLKNSFLMWSAIRSLEEAGIHHSDLPEDDRNILLLKEVWQYLEAEDPSFSLFRQAYSDVAGFSEALSSCFKTASKTIVIHGFYYFTPIQSRILHMMEEVMGLDLIFLFQYDDNYPCANEIWTKYYAETNGFESKDRWIGAGHHSYNMLGELLEGRFPDYHACELVDHEDVIQFVEDVGVDDDDKRLLFSPDHGTANEMLKQFYPEKYTHRTLSSYPIGHFIQILYSLWDSEANALKIDSQSIAECFASGWVSLSDRRSNEYMRDLLQLLPFFGGCTSIEEWGERLEKLIHIQDDIVSQFRSESIEQSVRRWEDVLGNPFSNFGMFDVEQDRMKAVITMIKQLLDYVRLLFGGNEAQDMSAHVQELLKILNRQTYEYSDLKIEYDLVSTIISSISIPTGHGVFQPSELMVAIRQYLSNELYTNPEDEDSDPVQPMDSIQSLRGGEKLHVCLCDSRRMPGGETEPVWPLSLNLMVSLDSKTNSGDRRTYLADALFVLRNATLANRYLLYRAFFSQDIKLSWISKINDKDVAMSPYINLMHLICGLGISKRSESTVISLDVPISNQVMDSIPFSMFQDDIIEDAGVEFGICPRRFLYSFVLRRNPTYTSRFSQSFAATGLISSLCSMDLGSKYSDSDKCNFVLDLMPYLNASQMQSIRDFVKVRAGMQVTPYKGRKYTRFRYLVRYPPALSKFYSTPDGFDPQNEVNLMAGHPNPDVCMYCPHADYCSDAKFGVDRDGS